MRTGTFALSLLSVPLNVSVLQTLAEDSTPLVDLRRAAGSPPPTTMRKHLRNLTDLGIVERRRLNDFPGSVDYALTPVGHELLAVGEILGRWLQQAPERPLELGERTSKSVVKSLVDGWSSTIVRALAARPLSLTDLNRLITGLNYPSLERRLAALRLAGLIEACPSRTRGTPYTVSDWLRSAVAPLVAAARWERRHLQEQSSPIAPIDVEAAFLLSVPTMPLPVDADGLCRLAVEFRNGGEQKLAGVLVAVENGQVASCVSKLRGEATAWASGSTTAWLSALIEGDTERLEIGGDYALALTLMDELHGSLFRAGQRR